MQRQSILLSRSEKCIVGTGLERQVALELGVFAIADHEGKIISTDSVATIGGELALEKNVLVAYMPWEGYNN
ncbi:hypothetical protein Gotri_019940 [Gossypium trilobum]|uniref:DNA-directed RNA polymerase n=1 Tax=Gossypium trilobum TaxID=34281 RepID=A0A7J9D8K3_9ROSI|nr:hypothetical protein [Gossypium trilobum]